MNCAVAVLIIVFLFSGIGVQAQDDKKPQSPIKEDVPSKEDFPRESKIDPPPRGKPKPNVEFTEIGDYPLCDEVFAKKRQENILLIKEQLSGSEALALFDEGTYDYPSASLLRNSGVKATREQIENKTPPVYFAPETKLLRLVPGPDVQRIAGELKLPPFPNDEKDMRDKDSGETVGIAEIQAGDLILSTTSVIITEDKRYQTDCWGRVNSVLSREMKSGTKLAALIYEPKDTRWEQTKADEKVFVVAPPCIYCRKGDIDNFKDISCNLIRRGQGSQLKSPANQDDRSFCSFRAFDPSSAATGEDQSFYNLSIYQTGVYYIGPIGAEILVHN